MKLKLFIFGVAALSCFQPSGLPAQDISPIIAEGIINAPIDTVWASWTTSDGLRSWLAPHAETDLRIGGLMRSNYHAQGTLGDPRTIENTILSFEPQRMLSIKVSTPPQAFPFPNAIDEMWTVIYFKPADSARTHLRVVGLGFRATEESQNMRAFFERGNVATVQQLQRRFPDASR